MKLDAAFEDYARELNIARNQLGLPPRGLSCGSMEEVVLARGVSQEELDRMTLAEAATIAVRGGS